MLPEEDRTEEPELLLAPEDLYDVPLPEDLYEVLLPEDRTVEPEEEERAVELEAAVLP